MPKQIPNEDGLKKRLHRLDVVTAKLSMSPERIALVGPILSLYDEIYQNTNPSDTQRDRITRAKHDLVNHDLIKKIAKKDDQGLLKELVEILIDLREDLQALFKSHVIEMGMRSVGMAGSKRLAGEEELQALVEQMKGETDKVVKNNATKQVLGVLAALAKKDEDKTDVLSPDNFTLQLMKRVFDVTKTDEKFLGKSEKAEGDLRDEIYLAALKEALEGYNKLERGGSKIKDPMVGSGYDKEHFTIKIGGLLKDTSMEPKQRMEAIKESFVEAQSRLGKKVDNKHAQRLNRFIGLLNKKLGTKLPYYRSEKAKEIKRHMHGIFDKAGVQTAAEKEKAEKAAKKRDKETGKKHGI